MLDPMTRERLLSLGIPEELLDIIAKNVDGEAFAALNAHEERIARRREMDLSAFRTLTAQFGMGIGILMRVGVTGEEMHEFVDLLIPMMASLTTAFEAYDKERRS